MQNKKQFPLKRRIVSFTLTLTFVIAAITVALNAQLLKDGIRYYQFTPDPVTASFADVTGMSSYGKFLYQASHPLLEGAETFNHHCSTSEMNAAILGCYTAQKIYIYNVTDARLEGIRPTTAAHEMLHAGYERLSKKEKEDVNRLLEARYQVLKDDTELAERMKFYETTQPGDRYNELHSILGTEVADVGPELDSYYQKYFSDRRKVIAQHQQYHALFAQLQQRANTLNKEIAELGASISQKRANYESESRAAEAEITTFNQRAQQGGFTSQAAFTSERQVLVRRTASLEVLRSEINASILHYNELVEELNGVAVETNALNKSIDSNVAPAPSL